MLLHREQENPNGQQIERLNKQTNELEQQIRDLESIQDTQPLYDKGKRISYKYWYNMAAAWDYYCGFKQVMVDKFKTIEAQAYQTSGVSSEITLVSSISTTGILYGLSLTGMEVFFISAGGILVPFAISAGINKYSTNKAKKLLKMISPNIITAEDLATLIIGKKIYDNDFHEDSFIMKLHEKEVPPESNKIVKFWHKAKDYVKRCCKPKTELDEETLSLIQQTKEILQFPDIASEACEEEYVSKALEKRDDLIAKATKDFLRIFKEIPRIYNIQAEDFDLGEIKRKISTIEELFKNFIPTEEDVGNAGAAGSSSARPAWQGELENLSYEQVLAGALAEEL